MKKTTLVLLALCLLLSACGPNQNQPSETGQTPGIGETALPDRESESAVSSEETGPAAIKKELHPEMKNQAAAYDYIETENAIYYCDNIRKRIYFSVDHGSHFYPLCSKVNCTHSDENCTASGNGVAYFEGALYTIRFDSEAYLFGLVRISLDGTYQGMTQSVPFAGSGGFRYFYHNGKAFLYYAPSANTAPLEELKDRLFVIDLRTGEITEPLKDLLKGGLRLDCFQFYQNIMTAYTQGTYVKSGLEQSRALVINLDTWGVREYMKGAGRPVYYIDDSKLYFLVSHAVFYEKGEMHIEKQSDLDEGFYEVDIQTGEIVQRLATEDAYRAACDEDYIYVTSYPRNKDGQYHTLYIYNRNYELVEQEELEKYECLVFASGERLFFSREYNDFYKIYRYMEKADIGSGNMPIYDVNK